MRPLVAVAAAVLLCVLLWRIVAALVDASINDERRACEQVARGTPVTGRTPREVAEAGRMRRRIAARIAARGDRIEEPALAAGRARRAAPASPPTPRSPHQPRTS